MASDPEIRVDRKTKTTIWGVLLLIGGFGCFFLFIAVFLINATRISSPRSTTVGKVLASSPQISTSDDYSRKLSSCSYSYSVEGKIFTLISTCGEGAFASGDTPGDEVEIIYETNNPSKAMVNRQSTFNCVGILGIPLLIFGWLVIRDGKRMSAGEG